MVKSEVKYYGARCHLSFFASTLSLATHAELLQEDMSPVDDTQQ